MLTIINDTHLGVLRSAGTTPASALALRQWMLNRFEQILDETDNDLLLLGDLFDTYQIPMTDLLQVYWALVKWLENKDHTLHMVPGNHDLSTDSTKMSSFQFLGSLLAPYSMVYHTRGGYVAGHENIWVIPHVANQDLFDMELAKVPECNYLLVHCNYDNNFAKESDHSLNMSSDQVKACKADQIVFAHEHAGRRVSDKVFILGNTIPSSVSDCLDGKSKCVHTIDGADELYGRAVWDISEYKEIDWREPVDSNAKFIRFVGTCTAEESAQAADVVSRYRRGSEAFVVGSAIRVQTAEGQAQLEVDSLEAVRSFDILAALKKYLNADEWTKVENLK